MASDWWSEYECSRHLCVPPPPILACYSNQVLNGHSWASLVWCVACSEFVVYALVSIFALASSGTSADVVCDPYMLDVTDSGDLISLPSKVSSTVPQVGVLAFIQ